MREILFRGKPKTDYWFFSQIWVDSCKDGFVYGSLLVSKDKYYICVSAICAINQCVSNGTTSMIEVDPSTVGQYTGLTDKKEKRIFEGDIMVFEAWGFHYRGLVSFVDGNFCVICKRPASDLSSSPFLDDAIKRYDAVCIDNIHDNADLLK